MKTASWVITDKATNKAVMETFNADIIPCLNTDKYNAVPIMEYLQSLNKTIPQS